ncbi:MAG TPA: efflux RND transporter periplasmic adaptor subunit [Polyangiales bacterium]|nr:efflux RND transporter periplasmic adaptor subunit [Polyangiales bacterium]
MAERNSGAIDDQLQIPENAGRSRLPQILLAFVLLVGIGGGLAYYFRPKPKVELYLTQPVSRRDIVQRIEAAGRTDVRRRVEIPAPTEGRLLSINVRAGDNVSAGQLLALLDERAAKLAVRGAEANEAAAASNVREAETASSAADRNLARLRSLQEKGLASVNDVANAESELQRTKAAVAAAQAGRKVAGESTASAKLSKSLGQITASEAGVVLRAPERLGAAVSPEMGPLFLIGDPLDVMRVDAKVSETDIALLRDGQEAQVSVAALDGRTFKATVERRGIDPELELGAVLYPVTLRVENSDKALLPGMTARVSMEVNAVKQALAVHEAALRFVPEEAATAQPRTRVFRRVGTDQIEEVQVKPGISDGMWTAVEPVQANSLNIGDALAIGFVRPDQGSRGPRVTLGDKK